MNQRTHSGSLRDFDNPRAPSNQGPFQIQFETAANGAHISRRLARKDKFCFYREILAVDSKGEERTAPAEKFGGTGLNFCLGPFLKANATSQEPHVKKDAKPSRKNDLVEGFGQEKRPACRIALKSHTLN
jgi:hypothetical protein